MVAKRRYSLGFLALSLLGSLTLSASMAARPHAQTLPPTAKVGGLSNSEWAARWWQWAYSIPKAINPLFDTTGANAVVGQSGKVWFLGGVYNETGTVVRNITIPTGTHLFFPIVNIGDNRICPGEVFVSIEALREELRGIPFSNLSAEVDGRPVENLEDYLEESVVFNVTVPEDSITCVDSGTYGPMVDRGYYLMLAPLSVGQHTIHFAGALPWFSLDITYNITVAPRGQYAKP